MAGIKLTGNKDRFGVLLNKHEVASWIKDKLGDVNVVDVKRNGLIIVGCVSQTQLKKLLEI